MVKQLGLFPLSNRCVSFCQFNVKKWFCHYCWSEAYQRQTSTSIGCIKTWFHHAQKYKDKTSGVTASLWKQPLFLSLKSRACCGATGGSMKLWETYLNCCFLMGTDTSTRSESHQYYWFDASMPCEFEINLLWVIILIVPAGSTEFPWWGGQAKKSFIYYMLIHLANMLFFYACVHFYRVS